MKALAVRVPQAQKPAMARIDDLPRLIAARDWPAAERLLRRAAEAKAAPADVFYNLAKVLEAAGKPGQRTAWLRRAVAARPGYGIAWFELGRALLDAADAAAALAAFRRAAALLPEDAETRRMVGRLALGTGDWGLAAEAWADLPGAEAAAARYRADAERGLATEADRARLLADPAARPEALKALTRTAKGALPLRLPGLRT